MTDNKTSPHEKMVTLVVAVILLYFFFKILFF
jgi:hypothetical protein